MRHQTTKIKWKKHRFASSSYYSACWCARIVKTRSTSGMATEWKLDVVLNDGTHHQARHCPTLGYAKEKAERLLYDGRCPKKGKVVMSKILRGG